MVAEDLSSIFTFDPLQNPHLESQRLSNRFLTQRLSLDEIYSRRQGRSGKQKRLILVRLPLFKACNCVLSKTEESYLDNGFHVDIAKKKQTAQLKGLLREEGLRGMMERKKY